MKLQQKEDSCWEIQRRSPRGGRGLKLNAVEITPPTACRSPRGGRGLKWKRACNQAAGDVVVPREGDVD